MSATATTRSSDTGDAPHGSGPSPGAGDADRPEGPVSYMSCFSMPLSPDELRAHQQHYLDLPPYCYGLPARLLFWTAGKAFPQGRGFEFFAFVEDHAMRQYAAFVAEHPEFDETPWESAYRGDYGFHATVGDMLRQIAVDEEQHKVHSERYITSGARFSSDNG